MNLQPNSVHVWLADPDVLGAGESLQRCERLLSEPERLRHCRFHFEPDRKLYAVAHALVRTSLSRYGTTTPAAWRFEHNQYGRPEIIAAQRSVPLRFNLSHTRGLVACAVALDREIGVDVENLQPRSFTLDVASAYFAPAEVRRLFAAPEHERRDRFFDYWTLKESYIKARGMGLALPLEQFAFDLGTGADPIRVALDPRLEDDASSWQFMLDRPSPQHRLALAARRATSAEKRAGVDPVAAIEINQRFVTELT